MNHITLTGTVATPVLAAIPGRPTRHSLGSNRRSVIPDHRGFRTAATSGRSSTISRLLLGFDLLSGR